MKVVAWVGYPACGKSTASEVARSMGIPCIVMGDIIREEVQRRELEPNDANTGAVADELRKSEGMDAIAKRTIPKIMKEKNSVVVDGIRGISEVKRFKEQFKDDFILVAILSPFNLRFERMRRRGRDDDGLTHDEFRMRDEREEGWGLPDAITASDITVKNDGDLEVFSKKIREILTGVILR
ncbi:MAG: AAA family ATPase [Candidatus Syntrophoarchaeum sp.]|nr:AAA family ATPase [Candidatus Syntrophoarchaeum sp.]